MVILLAMPLIFILVLGISLGEGFGKKATLRVSVVNLDRGLPRFFDRSSHRAAQLPFPSAVLRCSLSQNRTLLWR